MSTLVKAQSKKVTSKVTLSNVLNSDEQFKKAMRNREKITTAQPVLVSRIAKAYPPNGKTSCNRRLNQRQSRRTRRNRQSHRTRRQSRSRR
jgi:hypothetical protein